MEDHKFTARFVPYEGQQTACSCGWAGTVYKTMSAGHKAWWAHAYPLEEQAQFRSATAHETYLLELTVTGPERSMESWMNCLAALMDGDELAGYELRAVHASRVL